MKTFFIYLSLSVILLNLTACAPYYRYAFDRCAYRVKSGECVQKLKNDGDIPTATHQAADALIQNSIVRLQPSDLLWVTTIADIDDLENSSSLGRLLGEQLSVRLSQRGYTVLEPKMDGNLSVIPYSGEFVLSRHFREIGERQNVQAIVTGTYAIGIDTVYITLKILNFSHGRILASHAYELPIGPNTYALLRKPQWWWY